MENIFTRIKQAVAADFHEILDKKEEKNPTVQLSQYIRQCEQQAKKIRELIEKQYQLKHDFTKEYHAAQAMADKRERQAKLAAEQGEAELAEQAQEERGQYQERADKIKAMMEKAASDLQELEKKYVQMKHKLKDLYVKKMEFAERENVAKAHRGMNEILKHKPEFEFASNKFNDLEGYIDRLERKVDADYRKMTLDAKLAELERKSS
ncbi:PspA/IM30 family protein [Terribacillus sp. 7520-G]|uniref:PspA/IM30 family protein n=1 Tax=Terribacillus TaxID=459532 RepID=UPI000BA6C67B|nr:PspA/IM30 family protein [Terribacillus sp. 7520-G]PAD40555.1 modulator protein [Terribacillus sp. 7520-G]